MILSTHHFSGQSIILAVEKHSGYLFTLQDIRFRQWNFDTTNCPYLTNSVEVQRVMLFSTETICLGKCHNPFPLSLLADNVALIVAAMFKISKPMAS